MESSSSSSDSGFERICAGFQNSEFVWSLPPSKGREKKKKRKKKHPELYIIDFLNVSHSGYQYGVNMGLQYILVHTNCSLTTQMTHTKTEHNLCYLLYHRS